MVGPPRGTILDHHVHLPLRSPFPLPASSCRPGGRMIRIERPLSHTFREFIESSKSGGSKSTKTKTNANGSASGSTNTSGSTNGG